MAMSRHPVATTISGVLMVAFFVVAPAGCSDDSVERMYLRYDCDDGSGLFVEAPIEEFPIQVRWRIDDNDWVEVEAATPFTILEAWNEGLSECEGASLAFIEGFDQLIAG